MSRNFSNSSSSSAICIQIECYNRQGYLEAPSQHQRGSISEVQMTFYKKYKKSESSEEFLLHLAI